MAKKSDYSRMKRNHRTILQNRGGGGIRVKIVGPISRGEKRGQKSFHLNISAQMCQKCHYLCLFVLSEKGQTFAW